MERTTSTLQDKATILAKEMLKTGETIKPVPFSTAKNRVFISRNIDAVQALNIVAVDGVNFYIGHKKWITIFYDKPPKKAAFFNQISQKKGQSFADWPYFWDFFPFFGYSPFCLSGFRGPLLLSLIFPPPPSGGGVYSGPRYPFFFFSYLSSLIFWYS